MVSEKKMTRKFYIIVKLTLETNVKALLLKVTKKKQNIEIITFLISRFVIYP